MANRRWLLCVAVQDHPLAPQRMHMMVEEGPTAVAAFLAMRKLNEESGEPAFLRYVQSQLVNAWPITKGQYDELG